MHFLHFARVCIWLHLVKLVMGVPSSGGLKSWGTKALRDLHQPTREASKSHQIHKFLYIVGSPDRTVGMKFAVYPLNVEIEALRVLGFCQNEKGEGRRTRRPGGRSSEE